MRDVFGAMLTAAYEDPSVPEVTERDDGFLNTLRASRYFDPISEWTEVDRWALDQCRGRVLDVGAGGGRAALELHERGQEVVALDSSLGSVEVCRRQGLPQAVHGTLSTYDHQGKFDTYLFFGNNLGLLESTAHGRALLGDLAVGARPGTTIVGTSMRPELTSNATHLRYHEWNRSRGRWPGQLRLRSRFGGNVSDWFDYLLIDPDGLDEMLVPTPWRRVTTFEQGVNYAVVLTLVPHGT